MKQIKARLWVLTLLLVIGVMLPAVVWADSGHRLTVQAKPAMAGSFNQNSAMLETGATIHLYAYANSSFTFVQWTDESGDVVSKQMDFVYTMPDRNVRLTAEYEYNPANPANPARNYWNKELGEVIVDDFATGQLQSAVKTAIGDDKAADVMMITVAGVMNNNDFGVLNTYSACTLLDLSRVTGVTQVPSYAFDYTKLESVYLPASIERIGYRAFYECKQLFSLIVYAMTPPTLGDQVFTNVPEGLVVYVPASAISQYQDAEGWKNFTILPIQEDIRNITVSLPAGTNAGDYAQMWLELTNTKSGQRMHYVMTDRQTYTFANIIRNTSWNIILRNERGDVFGQIDNVEVRDEDVSVTFAKLSKPQSVSVSVLTPDGLDVTAQTQVTWTDASGNYLAQGASMSGLPVGYQTNYRMVLPQTLAMAYMTPQQENYVLTDGDNSIICQLTAIPQVKISGKVKDATTGLPISGATISASQTFGGKYSKTVNAKTDGNGVFTLDIANVPTSVAFAASDYISQTRSFSDNELYELNELEDVKLKSITGATISLGFTYTTCEGEIQNWYSDYQNVSYELFNVTKNKAISQYNVQYPQIVLLEEVADGDVLRLTATSRTNAFMPVEVTATIAEQKAQATFAVVELGKIQSSFTSTGNAAVVGSLYDSTGKLMKTYSYSEASLTINDLADGQYTLVSMGSSRLFNTIYDLVQLPQTGLSEGIDYVKNTVVVTSGAVSQISIAEVPTLDESKLYYTGDNTSFTVNKPSIVAGNYLTLTGRIDFKSAYATSVSNVQMIVDLPESCEFVENSVMVGNSTSSYTLNGHQITIPMSRYTDRVRFCIIPTLGGEYAPSAFAQFDLDGETVTQPIGSANYTAKDLSISVPSTVAKTAIPVSGTAIGTSNIEIYDNNVLIGQTTSLANGTWATTCELNEPYNLSRHQIYAKVTTKQGIELTSENVSCVYDMNAIQVSVVKMYHDNPEQYKTYELTFDFLNPSSKEENYIYYIYNKKFTFTIDFTNNDTTKVSNVILYVKTAKSGWHPLEATYDAKQDKWVAAGEFGNMYDGDLPVNVSVDFNINLNPLADSQKAKDAIALCDLELADDIVLEKILNELGELNYCDRVKLQQLFDYLGIEDDETIEIPTNINDFFEEIENVEGSFDYTFNDGVLSFSDDRGNQFTFKNVEISDASLTNEDLLDFYSVPLNDSTYVYLHIGEDAVDVVYGNRLLALSAISFQDFYNIRRSASADEFFSKWNQYKTVLNNLQYIPKVKEITDRIKAFFLSGLTKREKDLKICCDIKNAWLDGRLSAKQLEELDMDKLDKAMKKLPKEIAQIRKGLGRLGALFKAINIASIINDINQAIESRQEWNEIIRNIESLDCPGMDELARKAKNYRDWVATGYTVNIAANVNSCAGIDKVLAFLATIGVAAGIGADLSMAVIVKICDVIVLALDDFFLIQGGVNQINDINWKWEIRSQIPGLKCNDHDPNDKDDKKDNGGDHKSNNNDKKYGIDPSGYVYEGVQNNRIEGVTATIYYKENVEDMYGDLHENIVKWDAEEYAQENPLFTDENGFYRWDVPQGLWQVKFEKEGYETTYSEWLPVPPPQLDVNIAMKQNVQPNVKLAHAYEDAVEVEFDKYMMPELLTAENIMVMQNGTAVEGTIELLNEEVSYEGEAETFASKIRFNAAEPFTEQEITLLVNNRVKSYAGIRMQDNYQQTFSIEQEIKQIVSDSLVTVGYGKTATVMLSVLPASASKGRVLTVKTSSPVILSVETEQVTIGNDGKAEIIVSGELPGTAALTFSVEGTDKTALTIASVEQTANKPVATPTASIASGSLVERGTKVELSCETEGATIYYTLDGSCPCDNTSSRKVYDGTPIVINKTITIKAMAVATDMTESDVAEFTYIVESVAIKGDVNGDGAVDIADVVAVYNIMAGNNQSGYNGDVNKDGATDIADVVAIYNIMAGR